MGTTGRALGFEVRGGKKQTPPWANVFITKSISSLTRSCHIISSSRGLSWTGDAGSRC